jgi:hypothetical protein
MKHHRCEVNHPKTTPKKFKRCLPPQRASDRNSVGASAGHRTAGLGAPGSLQNLIVRHHFSPSKRFKEASNRQKVLTPVFSMSSSPTKKHEKNPVTTTYYNLICWAGTPHLILHLQLCHHRRRATRISRIRVLHVQVLEGWKDQHTFPIGFSWIFTVEK